MRIPILPIGELGRHQAGVSVTSLERCTFLFLANGRAFIRSEDGEVCEADAWERNRAAILLGAQLDGLLDPVLGMELATN